MTANTRPQRRKRRMPTADELRVWREYIETAELLRTHVAASLQRECGLSTGDYVVLLALSEADGHRMRSSELASHIGWDRSRLSHHVGRMERRDLIRREECATDNRGAEIVLTRTGADAFDRSTVPHLREIRTAFVDALTAEQLAAAGDVARTLRAHLTETDQLPANGRAGR
ncbi:MarR family transcriptional regulator [Conexibacter stalactiti]|uniref:MarR family transcriptional regulator n=2 Tax=Conexibacter stalactiti TaxID=1940611 RepID=A0ABU4HUP7_9ACTN|nr:MarR family transcriptional regulator [Conexibacter stalactiti]MDW5597057.1 MarR family transcriptional regulator [Conexibacter stalactiti]MEC5037699.1 MarR family transcriptional regulator [Conexibacter stalactiti]